jgi:hypothetical protein
MAFFFTIDTRKTVHDQFARNDMLGGTMESARGDAFCPRVCVAERKGDDRERKVKVQYPRQSFSMTVVPTRKVSKTIKGRPSVTGAIRGHP